MLIFSDAFVRAIRIAGPLKPFLAVSLFSLLAIPASAETVAWWRFEEGVPNTRAAGTGNIFDVAGSYLNGTPFDGPIYRESPIPDSWLGLEFTGGGTGTQRVFIPDSTRLYLTHSLTLEAFIRYDGIPTPDTLASQIVFRGDSRDALDPYTLAIRKNGRLFLDISSLTERVQLESPESLPLGQYIHVAGTLNDATGEMKLFVNGVEVASKLTAARPFGALTGPDPGIGIGNVQSNSSKQGFGGMIDEVRISDVALEPAQFLNGGSVGANVPEAGMSVFREMIAAPTPVIIKRRRSGQTRGAGDKTRVYDTSPHG
jgi:hypothetical protein